MFMSAWQWMQCLVHLCVRFCSFGFFFFFQAEDGIRDRTVTGVQTCALPICGLRLLLADGFDRVLLGSLVPGGRLSLVRFLGAEAGRRRGLLAEGLAVVIVLEIGRASCRERV